MKCPKCGDDITHPTKTTRLVQLDEEEVSVPHMHYKCIKCDGKIITKEQINQCVHNFTGAYRQHLYEKYRGKCKEYSEKLIKERPELRLVRGFYYCPVAKVEEMHWWCEDSDGLIIDPTAKQYFSEGKGNYREFKGVYTCSNCKQDVLETSTNKLINGRHVFCNDNCYKDFMGCD